MEYRLDNTHSSNGYLDGYFSAGQIPANDRQEAGPRVGSNEDSVYVVWETMQPEHVSLWLRTDIAPKNWPTD
jgi:hypothetical protein